MPRFLFGLLVTIILLGALSAAGLYAGYQYYARDLPDPETLRDYQPPTTTRVHAADGRLMAEFAAERRIFVPYRAIPARVKQAFIAAEDKNYYQHQGVDPISIARAVVQNLRAVTDGGSMIGGSTITQQVVKNMLLTNERSFDRKVREAIIAYRMDQVLSKDRVLELYLNEIFLGYRSYGVAQAALNYFNKPLDQLTIGETAFLAALPKAPNNYDPVQFPDRARERRDYVIERMREDGHISPEQAAAARAETIQVRRRDAEEMARADYFTEEVRRQLIARFGEEAVLKGGLSVRASLDPELQVFADQALRGGLIAYDRRHGWRGPMAKDLIQRPNQPDWQRRLAGVQTPPGIAPWRLAVVLALTEQHAEIGIQGADGATGRIPMTELAWARPWQPEQRVGNPPRRPSDVFGVGDLVLVEPVQRTEDNRTAYPPNTFGLRQIPDVGGALVAMDPHTGRVLAMSGGWSFEVSQFNRATQAQRQPGSSFKPFVYMAALDNGFQPNSIVLDAPFVVDTGPGQRWRPQNYSERFYGPIPMRVGMEQSRNLMTVRMAEAIGMDKVVDYAQRFGIVDRMQPVLSMSLGAAETTVMRMTTGYAMMVNGGKRITPSVIDRVQDREGRTVFRHDERACTGCNADQLQGAAPPRIADTRDQVVDPATAYQMVAMLQGVVQRGTGGAIGAALRQPLAGKTGTTNDENDAWFVGFTPDLAVGVYIGFDTPRHMGRGEGGSRTAAPVFQAFMANALRNRTVPPFRVPPGVRLVRINPETGELASANDAKAIMEAFKPGTEPVAGQRPPLQAGTSGAAPPTSTGGAGVGGLY